MHYLNGGVSPQPDQDSKGTSCGRAAQRDYLRPKICAAVKALAHSTYALEASLAALSVEAGTLKVAVAALTELAEVAE